MSLIQLKIIVVTSSKTCCWISVIDDAIIDNLKVGVLQKLLPDLRKTQESLAEMT